MATINSVTYYDTISINQALFTEYLITASGVTPGSTFWYLTPGAWGFEVDWTSNVITGRTPGTYLLQCSASTPTGPATLRADDSTVGFTVQSPGAPTTDTPGQVDATQPRILWVTPNVYGLDATGAVRVSLDRAPTGDGPRYLSFVGTGQLAELAQDPAVPTDLYFTVPAALRSSGWSGAVDVIDARRRSLLKPGGGALFSVTARAADPAPRVIVNGVELSGYLSDLGLSADVYGHLPQVAHNTWTVGGGQGVRVGRAPRYGEGEVTVTLRSVTRSWAEALAGRDRLAGLLNRSLNTITKIVGSDTRTITVRRVDAADFSLTNPNAAELEVQCAAPDPFWYGADFAPDLSAGTHRAGSVAGTAPMTRVTFLLNPGAKIETPATGRSIENVGTQPIIWRWNDVVHAGLASLRFGLNGAWVLEPGEDYVVTGSVTGGTATRAWLTA